MNKGVHGMAPGRYAPILSNRDVVLPLAAATVARLSLSMGPLGILIHMHRELGSYTLAGLITGVCAAGTTLGTPVWGRLMDRSGQRPVLLVSSALSAACLSLLSVAVVGAGTGRRPLLIGLALGAGLCYPPISPALRASLRRLKESDRRAALAIDATSVELIFVAGPLLLSALLADSWSPLPLVMTAAVMLAGTLGYCFTRAADLPVSGLPRAPVFPRSVGWLRAARWRRVPTVVLVMFTLSCGFGLLDTSLAGTADRVLGGADHVWMLFAAIAGGSATGGFVAGMRTSRWRERRTIRNLLVAFAVLVGMVAGVLSLVHPEPHGRPVPVAIVWLVGLLFAAGLTIAPTLIAQQLLLDRLVRRRMNLAQALLSAANSSGVAVGTLAAGVVIDHFGLRWSSAAAAATGLLAAALVTKVDCADLEPSPDQPPPQSRVLLAAREPEAIAT